MFAICAVAKDEPEYYAREWIDWHRNAGVDKFIIYDHGEWVVEGKDIEVRPCPGEAQQLPSYDHCLRNCDNADYLAFIDIDEFLMGPILDRLNSIENGLIVNGKIFGTSGLEHNPTGKQMGTFQCYCPADGPYCCVKSIVRPQRTCRVVSPHCFQYLENGVHEDFSGNRLPINDRNQITKYQNVCFNHYFTRSMSDWRNKISRGSADSDFKRRFESVFLVDHFCSEIGGGKVDNQFLPYLAEARYGVPDQEIDVTHKVREMIGTTGGLYIKAGQYNAFFGDSALGKLKALYLRFERNKRFLGELHISEAQSVEMP